MKITHDYPGGNIIVHSIEYDVDGLAAVVKLEQDIRDTKCWWFYWNFCVIDPPVGTVEFHFVNDEVVSCHGATTCTDAINWKWCEDLVSRTCFRYTFEEGETKRYFAFSLPYQVADFERWFERYQTDPRMNRSVLTMSEQNRPLPLLKFGNGDKHILFTARHHCCESTASYVLEGVIDALLEQHSDVLEDYCVHVIPFIDIDGVENGDQGKERAPHDHNRDYNESPLYASTKGIYEYTKDKQIAIFIDFHSPMHWGPRSNWTHIHYSSKEGVTPDLQFIFGDHLRKISSVHPIVYDDTAFASLHGSRSNKTGAPSSAHYFREKNANIALTIETPYSGVLEVGYTKEMLHTWGEDVAEALCITLKTELEKATD